MSMLWRTRSAMPPTSFSRAQTTLSSRCALSWVLVARVIRAAPSAPACNQPLTMLRVQGACPGITCAVCWTHVLPHRYWAPATPAGLGPAHNGRQRAAQRTPRWRVCGAHRGRDPSRLQGAHKCLCVRVSMGVKGVVEGWTRRRPCCCSSQAPPRPAAAQQATPNNPQPTPLPYPRAMGAT